MDVDPPTEMDFGYGNVIISVYLYICQRVSIDHSLHSQMSNFLNPAASWSFWSGRSFKSQIWTFLEESSQGVRARDDGDYCYCYYYHDNDEEEEDDYYDCDDDYYYYHDS